MRILLVDDEEPARRRLARLLGTYPDVTVVGEASSGAETLAAVEALAPDALMLDVRMPELDGLALAQKYAHLPPIVYVTAHEAFAAGAFEVNAVDYLLKPVRRERLESALAKLRTRMAQPKQVAASHPGGGEESSFAATRHPRVVTNDHGRVRFFDAMGISRFWAADKYTLFRVEGREHLTEEPLSAIETRLAANGFLRVHRAEVINVAHVRTLVHADGVHEVHLSDGQVARVSRRSLGLLKARLGLRD